MSATNVLHLYWQSNGRLNAAVPINRVYTGLSPIYDSTQTAITPPYVSMLVESEEDATRTSGGHEIFRQQIKLTIWHTDYDAAVALDSLVRNQLNRQSFSFDIGNILDIKPGTRADEQDKDTLIWKIARTYGVLVDLIPQAV